jgi:hypothetical protein
VPSDRYAHHFTLYMSHAVWDSNARRDAYLGSFGSEEEAARAHDRATIVFHGTEATTNVRACEVNACMCAHAFEAKTF